MIKPTALEARSSHWWQRWDSLNFGSGIDPAFAESEGRISISIAGLVDALS